MSMQTIKSIDGKEYVLLPINVYKNLKKQISACIKSEGREYIPFVPENYVDNPVLLARINANITQQQLASQLQVTQAYISKLEGKDKVSIKVMKKINQAISMLK